MKFHHCWSALEKILVIFWKIHYCPLLEKILPTQPHAFASFSCSTFTVNRFKAREWKAFFSIVKQTFSGISLSNVCFWHNSGVTIRGVTSGGEGGTIPRAPKSPNNDTSNFFNTVHLLPIDLRFEHGGAKLASCPGRHLTSLQCKGNFQFQIWLNLTQTPQTKSCFRWKVYIPTRTYM